MLVGSLTDTGWGQTGLRPDGAVVFSPAGTASSECCVGCDITVERRKATIRISGLFGLQHMGGLDTCVKGVSNLGPAMAILKLGCYGEVFVLQCEGQETRVGTKSRTNKWGNPELGSEPAVSPNSSEPWGWSRTSHGRAYLKCSQCGPL